MMYDPLLWEADNSLFLTDHVSFLLVQYTNSNIMYRRSLSTKANTW